MVGTALVEDVERTVPVTGAAEGLAVADDAAVELVDLFETAVLHQHRQDFAADSAGAVGDDRFVLEIVVLAGLDLRDEVAGGVRVGDDGVAELPDLRFHRIAAVEEDDIVAAFVEQLVQGTGFEMLPAASDTILGDSDFVSGAEGDELRTHLHTQTREVIALTVGPLDVGLLERGIGLRRPHVLLDVEDVPADGGVDAVLRHDHPPLEAETLGKGMLPQLDRFGVGQRSEDIEQDDLGSCHDSHSKAAQATVLAEVGSPERSPPRRRGGAAGAITATSSRRPIVDALRGPGRDTAKIGRECRVV